MSPRTVAEVVPREAWPSFRPERCPSKPRWRGPWNDVIVGRPVDVVRTARLRDHDVRIGTGVGAGGVPWQGATGGTPLQLFNSRGPRTAVWDLSRSISWWWWTPTFPIVEVALPATVRREGDPSGAWDRHVRLYDPSNNVLVEMFLVDKVPEVPEIPHGATGAALAAAQVARLAGQVARAAWHAKVWWGRTDWTVGYDGSGPGVAVFDTSKPYDPRTAPHGVVAAGTPNTPYLISWEEIQAGVIDHALFFVLDDYSAERPVGAARGTDGTRWDHPVRAGDLLRLSDDGFARLAPLHPHGTPERVQLDAMATHGLFVADKTGVPGAAGVGVTQDPRFSDGDGKIPPLEGIDGLMLSDFVLIKP